MSKLPPKGAKQTNKALTSCFHHTQRPQPYHLYRRDCRSPDQGLHALGVRLGRWQVPVLPRRRPLRCPQGRPQRRQRCRYPRRHPPQGTNHKRPRTALRVPDITCSQNRGVGMHHGRWGERKNKMTNSDFYYSLSTRSTTSGARRATKLSSLCYRHHGREIAAEAA